MNYLGHLLLSGQDETILIGNFLADRLNLKETQNLAEIYQKGISYHRYIDETTDKHAYFKKSLQLLYPTYSKYSSVVLDIYIDYLIGKNWTRITDESFVDFKNRVYSILRNHVDHMPLKTQAGVRSMVDHNWIDAYTTYTGLEDVFSRMDKRTSFNSAFVEKLPFLRENEDSISVGFHVFMDDIAQSCRQFVEIRQVI